MKLSRESKEVSQLTDEVKKSALKRGWRYMEKEKEVQRCKGVVFSAARCVGFREPRSTESCKSKKCRDFIHMLVFQGFDFKVLTN